MAMQTFTTKVRRLSRQLSNIPQLLQNVQLRNHPTSSTTFAGIENLWQSMAASSIRNNLSIRFNDNNNNDNLHDDDELNKNPQQAVNERTMQFMSIVYALLLIIIGAMFTIFNISKPNNQLRDIFVIIISIIGGFVIIFFHYDIIKFRHWALRCIDDERKLQRKQKRRQSKQISNNNNNNDNNDNDDENNNNMNDIAIISNTVYENDDDDDNDDQIPEYDRLSLTTAIIFDYYDKVNLNNNNNNNNEQLNNNNNNDVNENIVPENSDKIRIENIENNNDSNIELNNDKMIAYRYFHGRHANDFYLKIGMIVFCFGSITHIGIDLAKQTYFFVHNDNECQCISLLFMESVRLLFSFYQLYFIFKYSNIIINRYKNLARFALMHLIGTSISFWLDTIIDDAIDDYVDKKLNDYYQQNQSIVIIDDNSIINGEFHGLKNHIIFEENCSKKAIISNESLHALPYLYPFTIEYNIILASIWYMIWSNIGKVKDRSLFSESYEKDLLHKYRIFNDDEETEQDDNDDYNRPSLLLTVDCHASNKGLFLGLAILLIILITVIIFFSTIHKDVSTHFAVVIYTLQILLLTLSCFVIIPIAYYRMRNQLDVVNFEHRNNSFMMMDDILILIPIPFYFIHYTCSAIASIMINNSMECNNLTLIGIDFLTIIQVMIQSPFIVDNLRRCSNNPKVRFRKPGRELVTLILILNVTLWILNTLELKTVEEYHATHEYFGEFFTMILSHTTLPMMLFYRFHSSVCLSHIWKYAYEKDE
ncbi:proton channel OtopLc-like isoform X2 [Dermatophagoides pteronyssinus]|uniref:proton channel OtopLc-like isoform X2 n=1 Tax=Dermatophagoides pteronyssinus TaxID=6956 RepID=UPI003F6627A1